jgi:signal transduction histidine kinase
MPDGGRLTLTARLLDQRRGAEDGRRLLIEFKDTGEGMSEEQCRRAFTSLLSTTKSQGTGLGLAIVSRVVETHRGQLKLRSKLGRGTVISVILPV